MDRGRSIWRDGASDYLPEDEEEVIVMKQTIFRSTIRTFYLLKKERIKRKEELSKSLRETNGITIWHDNMRL